MVYYCLNANVTVFMPRVLYLVSFHNSFLHNFTSGQPGRLVKIHTVQELLSHHHQSLLETFLVKKCIKILQMGLSKKVRCVYFLHYSLNRLMEKINPLGLFDYYRQFWEFTRSVHHRAVCQLFLNTNPPRFAIFTPESVCWVKCSKIGGKWGMNLNHVSWNVL